jgi:hypothetical protein
MKKLLTALLWLPLVALAQTYPSPTFSTITLQTPLSVANGGSACSAASAQCLDNISGFSGTGFVSRTGAGTYSFTASTGSGSVVLSTGPTISNLTTTGTTTIPYSLTLNSPSATTVSGKLNQIVNFTDFNPACNGTTLDQTAWNNAIAAIGSTPTTLIVSCPSKINAALTFSPNTQVQFQANGEIIGTSGSELVQFQQQIIAGRTQIFSNLTPQADVGMTAYPEWFGGSVSASDSSIGFNQAYSFLQNVHGVISMAPGTYTWQNQVNAKGNIALIGAGQYATAINVSGTNINGLIATGALGSPLVAPVFGKFSITSTTPGTTNTGINLQFTALARLDDIQVNNFIVGVNMECATNSLFNHMGTTYTAAANGFFGWNINGGGGCNGGNASSIWRDTYVQGSGSYGGPTGQIGYKAYGAYVSDLYFSNAATAETNYGYYFDYSTSTASGYADVILQNPVVDGFTTQAILVDRLPAQQMITISDGWLNPVSMLAETDALYCNSCAGMFQASGMQIGGEANYAFAIGARIVSSSNVKITNSSFNDNNVAIKETGSTGSIYAGNSISNTSAHAGAVDILFSGSTGSIAANNTLNGYSSFGIQVDATSTGIGALGNTFQGSNISTQVQNLGSNPIGGGYTGTGLNVLATSPALTTPNLGTPSSVTLTNGTGLPISTGVSGLGTGVVAALGSAASGSGSIVLSNSPTITTPIINGVTNGSAAGSGVVGQAIANSTTGTAITSGTTVNATSISVPAGDWNCWGNATFTPTASTSVANIAAGLTTTSATLPASPNTTYLGATLTTGTNGTTTLNPTMLVENVSSSTTLYLVAEAASVTGGSGATVNGYVSCRRIH